MSRTTITGGLAAVLAGCAVALLPGPTAAGTPARADAVRIGVVGTLFRDIDEAERQWLMRPFGSLLETQTGLPGELLLAGEPDQLARLLADGKVQLGVFHGVEYAWARQRDTRLKPLVVAVKPAANLKAYLVVRRDGGPKGFADLRGKALALPLLGGEHCHLFLQRGCQAAGGPAKTFLGQFQQPADPQEALDGVAAGRLDAAVVHGALLDWYRRRHATGYARLRIAQESEPFPPGVLVYREGALDEDRVRRLQEGLLSTQRTRRGEHLLSLCGLSGFDRPGAEYDRQLTEILKAYPPPQTDPEAAGATDGGFPTRR
jgi:ABC-type phosphate/phosphonate transport system substrate-binding protein